MIKVLVVDDSAVAREFLVQLINRAPGMRVVGTASDGIEGVAAALRLRPDIITMDITMPRMSGPEAIDQIMHQQPTPIVVVTGNTITEEVRATFRSLESGALAILPRPHGMDSHDHEASADQLLQTLRLMSEIKVVRRWHRRKDVARALDGAVPRRPTGTPPEPFRVVAMGASTGGPSVLKEILAELPGTFPAPILVVQHIAAGFVEGFASWLRDACALSVVLAEAGMTPRPGVVYIAPDGAHLGLDAGERLTLTAPQSTNASLLCPSASHLFHAVAKVHRAQAIGVLLTGMGRDGADGLLHMRQMGAVTIAQDQATSVVHGMPAEAIALGAVAHVLPPPRIAELLTNLAATAYPLPR